MQVSDIQRLKELEQENQPLKQIYADISPEFRILKETVEKNALKPLEKQGLVDFAREKFGASTRLVYKVWPKCSKRWRRLHGFKLLAEIIKGVQFKDDERIVQIEEGEHNGAVV